MNEIEHDGKTYILKTQVEAIIKDRVSKVASRATEAEAKLEEAEKALDTYKSKQASLDMLSEQITSLKSDLAASETRFSRYQAMSKLGVVEPELVDAIESIYDKQMKSLTAKEQVDLDTWLSDQLSNVDNAPLLIRPHLKQLVQNKEAPKTDLEEALEPISEPLQQHNKLQVLDEAPIPPRTNTNAVPAPEGKDILRRANDPKFYNANHEAIRAAWEAKFRRG